METKYLITGQEVVVQKQIEGGFLVKQCYVQDWDDEDIYMGETMFVEHVFDKAPTEKLDQNILELRKEIEELEISVETLKDAKNKEEGLLNKILRISGLQFAVDYLNGDFAWYVESERLKVKRASSVYHKRNICIELCNGECKTYTLNNDYFGASKTEVLTFKTEQEALDERKNLFIIRINNVNQTYQWRDIEDNYWYEELLKMPDIIELIASQKEKIKKSEHEAQVKAAKDTIEKNQKILEGLTTAN